MFRVSAVFCLFLFAFASVAMEAQTAASRQKPKTTSSKSAASKPAKSTPAKKGPTTKVAANRRTKGRRAAAPRYTFQQHPEPERYKEIQQALADRGFFKGNVNGAWGNDSVDALKRFQVSQKITDDGKIGALSLAGLGLGPKHEASALVTPGASPATSAPSGGVTPVAAPPPATPAVIADPPPPHS